MKKQVDYIIIRVSQTRSGWDESLQSALGLVSEDYTKEEAIINANRHFGTHKDEIFDQVLYEDFADKIKEYMADGWVCQGTPILDKGIYPRQAMVKYED